LRLDYLVSFVAERTGAENSHRIIVLNEHDRPVPGQILDYDRLGYIGADAWRPVRRLETRQINLENRTPTRAAVGENETPCLFDDPVNRRQSETGSRAKFFRRKERVEDTR